MAEERIELKLLDKPSVASRRATSIGGNDGDYDPHMHRDTPKATSNFETLVHLLKGSLGSGILAMPQAFYNAGLITGVIATVLIGAILTYCVHLLVNLQYELCKRKRVPLLSYPESMQIALEEGPKCLHCFARASNIIVDVFVVTYQLGICCVYIVFVAVNIKKMCDPYFKLPVELHMAILLVPLIAINCIRNLKVLAPFSSLANVMTFVGIGIIVYYLVSDIPSDKLDLWGSIYKFPLYFGTALFALESPPVMIALENNMKSPKSFGGMFGVLNIGMSIIVILYTGMGTLGYIRYGKDCEASVTLNLPEENLAKSVKGIFAIAVYITYGLHCYVPVSILWNTYMLPRLQDSQHQVMWEYALRIGLVFFTFIPAIVIPRLGLFISLFGALCLSALGLAFPALMELCVRYPNDYGPFKYILYKDLAIIVFGIVGLVVGTATTMIEIIKSFTA